MRLLPRSLFGRLMLVLSAGLIVAQLLSATINLVERDSVLARASGMQPAQRIADIVTLLDSLTPSERARIVGILNVPPLVVSLDRTPTSEESEVTGGSHAAMFSAVLRAALGDNRPVRVTMTGTPPAWAPGPAGASGRFPMGGPMGPGGMHRFPPHGISFLVQVRLQDGTWATFDTQVNQESATLPWRMLLTLATLLAAVLLLSYIAVRWVTRPLQLLATAADELGRDINRPPLPEGGPIEVSRAASAFNTMQTRLVKLIDERTRLLTAMSHDLKTPLTRMRLRAEMLEDGNLRDKIRSGSGGNGIDGDADAGIHAWTQPPRAQAGCKHHGTARKPASRQRSHGPHCYHRRTYFQTLLRRTATPQALHLQSSGQRCPLW